MFSLREYRNRTAGLADFLPWAALIGEGVILNKDGSFQRTARFRGPDLDSATPAELVAIATYRESLREFQKAQSETGGKGGGKGRASRQEEEEEEGEGEGEGSEGESLDE